MDWTLILLTLIAYFLFMIGLELVEIREILKTKLKYINN
jgi:hypothetical protein